MISVKVLNLAEMVLGFFFFSGDFFNFMAAEGF